MSGGNRAPGLEEGDLDGSDGLKALLVGVGEIFEGDGVFAGDDHGLSGGPLLPGWRGIMKLAAMLKDRVALITGAAAGIGEAIARLFAGQGAHVHMLDRDADGCRRAAESICAAGGSAFF